MAFGRKATTVVSTKGQVILPKAIRDSKGWGPGKELVVQETEEGVLLRAADPFPRPTPRRFSAAWTRRGSM